MERTGVVIQLRKQERIEEMNKKTGRKDKGDKNEGKKERKVD